MSLKKSFPKCIEKTLTPELEDSTLTSLSISHTILIGSRLKSENATISQTKCLYRTKMVSKRQDSGLTDKANSSPTITISHQS